MMVVDYSLSICGFLALALGIAMPGFLFVAARLPMLARRNALQFLVAFFLMLGSWLAAVFIAPLNDPVPLLEWVVGLAILGSASLLYLEVWALLSRGYTLGLLLTLFAAKKPLNESDLARKYHGGDGLDWIMKHRLSGLAGPRLVTIREGVVSLSLAGIIIGRLYKISVAVLGLRKTG
jgi:hypothetical protein